jgi:hypothetical protein
MVGSDLRQFGRFPAFWAARSPSDVLGPAGREIEQRQPMGYREHPVATYPEPGARGPSGER